MGEKENNNSGKLEKVIENDGRERVFDIFMTDCKNSNSNEKLLSELLRRLDAKVESVHTLKNFPEKKKTLYELTDSGEIIIDEEIKEGKINRDIAICSYKKDAHDDICFYLIHYHLPKEGRAIFYENSNINMNPPRQLINPDSNYAREINDNYDLRPSFLRNIGLLEFKVMQKKEEGKGK